MTRCTRIFFTWIAFSMLGFGLALTIGGLITWAEMQNKPDRQTMLSPELSFACGYIAGQAAIMSGVDMLKSGAPIPPAFCKEHAEWAAAHGFRLATKP